MSGESMGVAGRLRTIAWGVQEPRLRATWRVLLAFILLPLVGRLVAQVLPLLGVSGPIPGGPLQAVIFFGILVAWARYIDRRPLSDYGISASGSWVENVIVGFAMVVAVWSGWHVFAASQGWMQIDWTLPTSTGVIFELIGMLISLALNTLVQDLVFFAIVLKGAAEGLHSRGINETRAVIGGWVVGIVFFVAIHGQATHLDTVNSVVAAGVFGLLYLHTADLAMTLGVHWGSSYAAGVLLVAQPNQAVSLFEVSEALAWAKGMATPVYLYLFTYLLLVGWITLRRGDVTITPRLAEWTKRQQGMLSPQ